MKILHTLALFVASSSILAACGGPQVGALPDGATDEVRDAARDCDRGDQLRCLVLADAYLQGFGVPQSVDAAVPLLRSACASGLNDACLRSEEVRLPAGASAEAIDAARRCDRADQSACTALGVMYRTGSGVAVDHDRAGALINRACEFGHELACTSTEEARLLGAANAELSEWARQCDRGDRNACRDLGGALLDGTSGLHSPSEGMRLLEDVCARRDVVVCARLARIWRDGDEVAPDIDRAAFLAGTACAGGFSEACGYLRETELPTTAPSDVLDAARACDRGDHPRCVDLAVAHAGGDAWGGDARIAARILDVECEAGDLRACTSLAELARSGEGVPRDSARAARLFELACAAGDSAACVEVGNMFNTGAGVVRDPAAAREYWRIGCEAGNAEACELLPGWAEAGLPINANDRIRNLARTCDRGTWASCAELGAELHVTPSIEVDPRLADDLLLRACTNGLAEACAVVRYPSPCTTDVLNADGAVSRTIDEGVDMALIALGPDGREPAPTDGGVLPVAPRGADVASLDPRVALTWDATRDQTDWPPGTLIEADEPSRTVRAVLASTTAVELAFDPSGRLVRLAERDGGGSAETLVISLAWDASGRLESLVEQGTGSRVDLRWTWDANNRLLSEQFERVVSSHTETRTRTFIWGVDNLDEQTEASALMSTAGRVVSEESQSIRFIYDAAGNLLRTDVRDDDRQILSSRVYHYECFSAGAAPGVR